MTKRIELLRHTDNDGDALTSDGIEAALAVGRAIEGAYDLVVTSGAQRATQTAACVLAGGAIWSLCGVDTDPQLRSSDEDRWRDIYGRTKDPDLQGFLEADPGFVGAEAQRFAAAVRRVADRTPDDGRSLVVGHGPLLEAAVWALTGVAVPALGKGASIAVVFDGESVRVEDPR